MLVNSTSLGDSTLSPATLRLKKAKGWITKHKETKKSTNPIAFQSPAVSPKSSLPSVSSLACTKGSFPDLTLARK